MALQINNLPNTLARLSPSIVIRATGKNGQTNSIGAVVEMSRTVTRSVSRRFELDSEVPGRAVEIIPGAVTNVSLTIKTAMLYTGSLLETLGFYNAEDLALQNVPIDIREVRFERPNPAAGPNGSPKTQVVEYIGCYFTNNPLSVRIDGDWQILQDFSLEVSKIITKDGPTN